MARDATIRFKATGLDSIAAEVQKFMDKIREVSPKAAAEFEKARTFAQSAGIPKEDVQKAYARGMEIYNNDVKINKMRRLESQLAMENFAKVSKQEEIEREATRKREIKNQEIAEKQEQNNNAKKYSATRRLDELLLAQRVDRDRSVSKAGELAAKADEQQDAKKFAATRRLDDLLKRQNDERKKEFEKELSDTYKTNRKLDELLMERSDKSARAAREQAMGRGFDYRNAPSDRDGEMGLQGFGGKMVLGHAVGQAVGASIGDPGFGQIAGSIVSAFMFGGPVIGSAVAGLELVGTALKSYRENLELARKGTMEVAAAMGDVTMRWEHFASSLVGRSGFGSTMEKEFIRSRDALSALDQKFAEVVDRPYGFNDFMSNQLGIGKNNRQTEKLSLIDQMEVQRASAKEAEKIEVAEYGRYLTDQRSILAVQQTMIPVAGMRNGLLKQEAELLSQIALRDVQRTASQRQQRDAAQAAIDLEQSAIDALVKQIGIKKNAGENTTALDFALDDARSRLGRAQGAAGRLPGQQLAENAAAAVENQRQIEAFNANRREALAQQQAKTDSAVARASAVGYAQKIALQRAADAEELRQASAQGAAMLALKQREITERWKAEATARAEELRQQTAKANEAYTAATSDEYHRDRAVRRAAEAEEIRQAAMRSPVEGSIKQAEITNRRATEHRALMEQQQHATDRAIISQQNRGYAEQKALREYAYNEQLKMAKAESEALYQLKLKEIEALRSVENRANRERIQDTMAAFSPTSAVGRLKRQMDDYKAMGASEAEQKALKDEALTGQIRRQTEHERIELALKTRRINQVQADVLNAMVENPLARATGPEGAQVRRALVGEAVMKEMNRAMEPVNVGQFSNKFEAGFVDISRVNMDRQLNQKQLQERANLMMERMVRALETMVNNGGLG